jgi:hypothetical protein
VVVTDWPEYPLVDLSKVAEVMTGREVYDTRASLDGEAVRAVGLSYLRPGKPVAA